MGPVVLDTGVIVALLDPVDAHHLDVVADLRAREASGAQFRISAISFSELLVVTGVSGDKRRERIRELVASFGDKSVLEVDADVAETAATLRRRRKSLRFADALIAATAMRHGQAPLLTTDRALSRLDGVELVGAARR